MVVALLKIGTERGADNSSKLRFSFGGVSMIIDERTPLVGIDGGFAASGLDVNMSLRREDTGVEGTMEWSPVGFVELRDSGSWGTRNKPAPLLVDDEGLLASKKSLDDGRVGVSCAVVGAFSLFSPDPSGLRDLNGSESGPENEAARRPDDGIMTGDSAREWSSISPANDREGARDLGSGGSPITSLLRLPRGVAITWTPCPFGLRTGFFGFRELPPPVDERLVASSAISFATSSLLGLRSVNMAASSSFFCSAKT